MSKERFSSLVFISSVRNPNHLFPHPPFFLVSLTIIFGGNSTVYTHCGIGKNGKPCCTKFPRSLRANSAEDYRRKRNLEGIDIFFRYVVENPTIQPFLTLCLSEKPREKRISLSRLKWLDGLYFATWLISTWRKLWGFIELKKTRI